MKRSVGVHVRVNGVPIRQLRLRGPESDTKLVIVDPVIGAFEIDDRDQRFHVEVLDLDIPSDHRCILPNGGWNHITVRALIAMLGEATNGDSETGDGDRCSWMHSSDLVELDGLIPGAAPNDPNARLALKKATRVLYGARIPYFIVGEYQPPENIAHFAALIIVPDAQQAHDCLCSNGFEAHPTSVHIVVHSEYSFVVHLVPDGKQKRRRK